MLTLFLKILTTTAGVLAAPAPAAEAAAESLDVSITAASGYVKPCEERAGKCYCLHCYGSTC
ncbi:hypothetical protein NEUTE1DRAFT_97986 [Neurospora tetrasperma FGSC 2508]|uniref:Uncharacterized protein n=1 Tax=Neurospora tetrasperma (strain FGSC 2508 / ATCC MYA-4615 / P0657) TaxID=510951 RepID=F8MEK3_NEUT8|nr:uncharacterized protein NEUTE1DRAFT_97986 [Neurospora tetrasperma FGSC 2508]EGO60834.1 hypothetical protein NEUTE1DRAFT_97986 [Neurospora tetrasperma FGSC 2508]